MNDFTRCRAKKSGFSASSPGIHSRVFVLMVAGLTAASPLLAATSKPASKSTDFNREIRPILSENCYACHGPDVEKRKAGLRLDKQDGALAELKSGNHAIVPGNTAKSALIERITTADEDDRMPPLKTGKHLTPAQIETLRKWIAEGAEWKGHWSFLAPQRSEVPRVGNQRWPKNPIDSFILARLQRNHLEPEAEALKTTLIRRVTFDLTGLPPTVKEVDAFFADRQPGAYERLVERLLGSQRYGEHMARYWLDVARYGDTHGLHLDNERSLWPYRDWVVEAFNRNLPFDQFTVWQLAGDLLPNPTREQLVASGYNRCNVSTSEGGAIDEEFQVRYAVDRVEATSGAWLGLTMGCAVCHDHKFDPILQKEFYQVFSIFNNISEKAMDGNALLPPPTLRLPTPEQEKQLSDFGARIRELEKKAEEIVASFKYADPASLTNAPKPASREIVWIEDDFPAKAEVSVNEGNESNQWIVRAVGPVFSGERALQRSGKGLHQTSFPNCAEPLIIGSSAKLFAYVYLDSKDPPKAIMLQYHTDEWRVRANWGDADAIPYGTKGTTEKLQMGPLPQLDKWVRLEVDATALGLLSGARITGMAFTQFDGRAWWDKAGLVSSND